MDRTAYEQFYELEKAHFWRIAKRRLVIEWIEVHAPQRSSLRFLDIGGACSVLPSELKRLGKVIVIEPDKQTVAFAKETLQIDIREGWLPDNLPVEGLFDVVTLLDCLEHLDEDEAALKAIWRLLQPGGVLICTVPALKWLWSDHDVSLGHRRRYLRTELAKLLTNAGFTIRRLSYHTSMLLPFLSVQRLMSRFIPNPDPQEYRIRVPPAPINSLFGAVMSMERFLLRHINLPVGSSLVAVCSKPTADVS
ncbi:MAG: class I SAM-dependent methyltransferase [Acidobacteriota bacterium]